MPSKNLRSSNGSASNYDNLVFSESSIQCLLEAAEKDIPNFSIMLATYLGATTLDIIRVQAESTESTNERLMGQLYFRNWFDSKKKAGSKESERYKELIGALTALGKPNLAEVLQQRYIDETCMRAEDFKKSLHGRMTH